MLKILKVTEDSLAPEYQNGDFVLVSKIPFLFVPPSPGDIIAFHQPGLWIADQAHSKRKPGRRSKRDWQSS